MTKTILRDLRIFTIAIVYDCIWWKKIKITFSSEVQLCKAFNEKVHKEIRNNNFLLKNGLNGLWSKETDMHVSTIPDRLWDFQDVYHSKLMTRYSAIFYCIDMKFYIVRYISLFEVENSKISKENIHPNRNSVCSLFFHTKTPHTMYSQGHLLFMHAHEFLHSDVSVFEERCIC